MDKVIKFLDLKQQYLEIKDEIDACLAKVIHESAFIGGKHVKSFEDQFANYLNAKHCIGVGNGTDAIEIALEALNIKAGSQIIVPANSFIATSEAVSRTGHKLVFCSCDPINYTIDVNDIRAKITPDTAALIAVHLYGHPCDMEKLQSVAKEYNLHIIEDCAQAHGAHINRRYVGTIGNIGCFSFYPGKNLGAYGDAGAITTQNTELAETCRKIANHGRKAKYDHEIEGRNSRLDGIQAAILSVKLKHLEKWTQQRIEVADLYNNSLAEIVEVTPPHTRHGSRHVFHLYVIRAKNRDELQLFLNENGIETGIHYPSALTNLSAYNKLNQHTDTDYLNNELLSLPMGPHINPSDVKYITETIKKFYKKS